MITYFVKIRFLSIQLRKVFIYIAIFSAFTQLDARTITTPEKFLGFTPGDDNKLADAETILSYFRLLDRQSDLLEVQELGSTTEGRVFWMALISAPENLQRKEQLISLQESLADPRKIIDAQAARLMRDARVVVAIACAIHPREIGSSQMAMTLAYRLLSETTPEITSILREVVIVLIPTHNPDGLDRIYSWWQQHQGTPFEAGPIPFLDHLYCGHDLNRDWVFLTQKETRLTVEKIYNVWRPHILFDIHQMQSNGARMFVPPYIDPIDEQIDPALQAAVSALGARVAADLTAQGRAGVAFNIYFDSFSPVRSYVPYHGGVRFLAEVASAKLAAPLQVHESDLKPDGDFYPIQRSWRNPLPWHGGCWSLQNIVLYELDAAFAILNHAARERIYWLQTSYNALKRAVAQSEEKPVYIIPPQQQDPYALYQLLSILDKGMVEIFRTKTEVRLEDVFYPAGSYIIPTTQPYGGYVGSILGKNKQILTSSKSYQPPYDVAGHHLGLSLGVSVYSAKSTIQGEMEKIKTITTPEGTLEIATQAGGYLIDYRCNQAVKAINQLLHRHSAVFWLGDSVQTTVGMWPPGSIWVQSDSTKMLRRLAQDYSLTIVPAPSMKACRLWQLNLPRIGIYASYIPAIDEGWTRFVLQEYGFPFTRLHNANLIQDNLNQNYDVIILSSQSEEKIVNGAKEGTMLPEYCGGIGAVGIDQLRRFVQNGGVLVTLNQACGLPLAYLGLPVKNAVKDLPVEKFICPGSFIKILVNTNSPSGYGLLAETAAFVNYSPVFEMAGGEAIAVYPGENLLLDGQLIGEGYLALKSAAAWMPKGRGAVLLLGLQPQFRAQTGATYKLLFNGLYRATAKAKIMN